MLSSIVQCVFFSEKVWEAAIRRLVSRADAYKVRLCRKLDAAICGSKPIPPLGADNLAWNPFIYFEYDDPPTRIITHHTEPYLDLISNI